MVTQLFWLSFFIVSEAELFSTLSAVCISFDEMKLKNINFNVCFSKTQKYRDRSMEKHRLIADCRKGKMKKKKMQGEQDSCL